MTDTRGTSAGVEPLVTGTPAVRGTAVGAEPLVTGTPAAQATAVGVEPLLTLPTVAAPMATATAVARVPARIPSTPVYVGAVMTNEPVGYWRLGEAAGITAADSSGNALDGTYTNGPTLAVTGLLSGDTDTAVSFDGSNDYVDLGNPTALRLTAAFTLEGWIKVTTGQTKFGAVIANAYDGTRVTYQLGSYDGSAHTLKPSVGFYDGTWRICQSASTISTNARHHLVGTWNGTSLKIYVDGTLANTTTPGVTPSAATANYFIGSRWDNTGDGQKFNGVLDEIAIFGTALSPTDVTAHFTAGSSSSVTIVAPQATATADANTTVVKVTPVAPQATATAAANAPSIISSFLVVAPQATAIAIMLVPMPMATPVATLATATATANAPTLPFTLVSTQATATADANSPTLQTSTTVTISAPQATATADALVPTLRLSQLLSAPQAVAQAQTDPPDLILGFGALVAATTAVAIATALSPSAVVPQLIVALQAAATAQALVPVFLASPNITVFAPRAEATAAAFATSRDAALRTNRWTLELQEKV